MVRKKAKGSPPGAPAGEAAPPATGAFTEEVLAAQEHPAFPVVGLGASAGGLEALTQFLKALPADTGMAFVVVQHLDPTHSSMLAEILSRATEMPVTEVKDEPKVEPNRVHVIPPNRNMVLADGVLSLAPRTEARGQHRPVDAFFRSLAEQQKHKGIGVVLSGTGTDGTLGLEEIKAEGGITFAQDATAQYDGMPRSAVDAGCVDFELSPEEIAKEIARIGQHPYVAPTVKPEKPPADRSLDRALELLCHVTGVDFSRYKQTTLYRRITRRMVLQRMHALKEYVGFLEQNEAEVNALFRDILISVTSFFRDPEAFEALKEKIFPALVKDRSRHEPLRMWVVGCSTGEETYSLAIAFAEFAQATGCHISVNIFATDLNGAAVEKARAGVYSKNIVADVSPERLRQFFVEEPEGSYRVSKMIREMCVFAQHNVLSDPPFSRVDLITCRNLLIYLEAVLQDKVVPLLHYALNPHGYLCLGTSETIGSYRDLFDSVDNRHKIHVKKPVPSPLHGGFGHAVTVPQDKVGRQAGRAREAATASGLEALREADRILLAKYAPAGVLVSSNLEILQFRGDTSPYLAPAPGKASLNLLKMLREGLLVAVRGALHKAQREETRVREEGLLVKSNGGYRDVIIEVIPVSGNSAKASCFLVVFEDLALAGRGPKSPPAELPPAPASEHQPDEETAQRQVERLTQELAATREYLQSMIEQQEASNEELQSANEEVQSTNEELQSINEELETSKEEIQSSNEELTTVNDELQNRNRELTQSNNDLTNLLASVQLAIVMLGPDLRIRRLTPGAEKILSAIPSDVGRPITDMKLNIDVPHLEQLLREVIDTVSVKEQEVQDKEGRWYSLRIHPYKAAENQIQGAVMVLVDVDRLKRDTEMLRRQAELLDQAQQPIFVRDLDGEIIYWNQGAQRLYGYTKDEALGRNSFELLRSPPSAVQSLMDALERDEHWKGELPRRTHDGQQIVVESHHVLVRDPDGRRLVLVTDRDITDRKRREEDSHQRIEELATADRNKNQFLSMLGHELRNPLAAVCNAVGVLKSPDARGSTVEQMWDLADRQLQNMTRMIDDLLDASRISQGRLELRAEPVELATIIRRAMDQDRHCWEARSQDLRLSLPNEPICVDADPTRLEQVFSNLLHNASKFSPQGGQIEISAEVEDDKVTRWHGDKVTEKESAGSSHVPIGSAGHSVTVSPGHRVTIRVRDHGVGISPELLPQIFELFTQGERSLDRSHGGLGIGLTLVRSLVELHGGSVEAHSAGPGQGSEFIIHLPVREGETLPVTQHKPREKATRSQPVTRRILVVDDNHDSANSLAMLLRLSGHEVQVCYDGPSALQRAAEFQPQVVLLDIGLPQMDGYEVARRLRRLPGLGKTLLAALTGYGQEEDRQHAEAAGFDTHLIKPIDLERLQQLLRAHGEGQSLAAAERKRSVESGEQIAR